MTIDARPWEINGAEGPTVRREPTLADRKAQAQQDQANATAELADRVAKLEAKIDALIEALKPAQKGASKAEKSEKGA